MAKSGWLSIKIEQLAVSKNHALAMGPFGSRITKDNFVDAGVPVIRGTNLSNGRFDHSDLVFLTEEKANELAASNAVADDLVFTHRGTLGQVGIIPTGYYPRYVVSQSQMKLTCDRTKVLPMFLYYYFRSSLGQHELLSHTGGSGVPAISSPLTTLKNAIVHLPPLIVQHKIAAILSAYDDLIENNTRRIAILEEMAQSLYQEWFVRFRYPGHEKNKMVESELGMIPEGWKVVKLSQLVNAQYGYTESAREVEVGPKFLRGMDINKTSYIQWDLVPYCTIDDSDYAKYKLVPGDIIIIRMADPGKPGIVEKEIDAIFASYLIRLRVKKGSIPPYYIFCFLNSEEYQNYIKGASTGTTRKSASAGIITDINLVIPPEDVLESFEKQFSLLRRMLSSLLDKNANLRRTRNLLLPKLISGEIDVETLDIEIPDVPEPEERRETPAVVSPEPIEATQLALPLS